jgi:uncharacterized protein (UPF0333 family)
MASFVNRVVSKLRTLGRDNRGQGTMEYMLVIGVGVVAAIVVLAAAAPTVFESTATAMCDAVDTLFGGTGTVAC